MEPKWTCSHVWRTRSIDLLRASGIAHISLVKFAQNKCTIALNDHLHLFECHSSDIEAWQDQNGNIGTGRNTNWSNPSHLSQLDHPVKMVTLQVDKSLSLCFFRVNFCNQKQAFAHQVNKPCKNVSNLVGNINEKHGLRSPFIQIRNIHFMLTISSNKQFELHRLTTSKQLHQKPFVVVALLCLFC